MTCIIWDKQARRQHVHEKDSYLWLRVELLRFDCFPFPPGGREHWCRRSLRADRVRETRGRRMQDAAVRRPPDDASVVEGDPCRRARCFDAEKSKAARSEDFSGRHVWLRLATGSDVFDFFVIVQERLLLVFFFLLRRTRIKRDHGRRRGVSILPKTQRGSSGSGKEWRRTIQCRIPSCVASCEKVDGQEEAYAWPQR